MDSVTKAIEWAQKRLELQGKELDSTQLETLNFALQDVRKELSNLNQAEKPQSIEPYVSVDTPKQIADKNRDAIFHDKMGWIQKYVMENLSDNLVFKNDDDEESFGTSDDILCYHEGHGGWDCEGEDNPIDKCVYSLNLTYGDDGCIFCDEPEERK